MKLHCVVVKVESLSCFFPDAPALFCLFCCCPLRLARPPCWCSGCCRCSTHSILTRVWLVSATQTVENTDGASGSERWSRWRRRGGFTVGSSSRGPEQPHRDTSEEINQWINEGKSIIINIISLILKCFIVKWSVLICFLTCQSFTWIHQQRLWAVNVCTVENKDRCVCVCVCVCGQVFAKYSSHLFFSVSL